MPVQKYWRCNGRVLTQNETCTTDRNGKDLDAPVAFDPAKHEEVDG